MLGRGQWFNATNACEVMVNSKLFQNSFLATECFVTELVLSHRFHFNG